MTRSRRLTIAGLLTLACLGAGALAADPFRIEVWEIRATKSNDKVSKQLEPVVRRLKKQFGYTGFKLEAKRTGSAKKGATFDARLSDGTTVRVTPLERKPKKKRLTLNIEIPGHLKTKVTMGLGASNLQGGWKYKDKSGDVVIVLIRAR